LQEIVSYAPGLRKNGTAVTASRSNPLKALGTPENNNTINFVSLGFGGTLIAKFDYVVFNQPGNDLRVFETSFGNPSCTNYPEKARISLSFDNIHWLELPEICQDGELDLGTLDYAQYIRIQDASAMSSTRFSGTADGYDLDGVLVLNNGCGSGARFDEANQGIAESEMPYIEAYPNPMASETHIRFPLEMESDETVVELFDASGRLVLSSEARIDAESNTVTIPTENLAKGLYHLVVQCGSETFHERLVK
jgi:hypothetical protein